MAPAPLTLRVQSEWVQLELPVRNAKQLEEGTHLGSRLPPSGNAKTLSRCEPRSTEKKRSRRSQRNKNTADKGPAKKQKM